MALGEGLGDFGGEFALENLLEVLGKSLQQLGARLPMLRKSFKNRYRSSFLTLASRSSWPQVRHLLTWQTHQNSHRVA